jgi:hypothetical protein
MRSGLTPIRKNHHQILVSLKQASIAGKNSQRRKEYLCQRLSVIYVGKNSKPLKRNAFAAANIKAKHLRIFMWDFPAQGILMGW